jgi:AGZA family xanthine/uracil permease-like MFS transporter
LAKKSGKSDVTAMPLGLDTPSTIGIALAVLGPLYAETKDAVLTWQVGMATLMLMGLLKILCSFIGEWVRREMPQAGLLGSLAGIGLALLIDERFGRAAAYLGVCALFSACGIIHSVAPQGDVYLP